MQELSDDLRFKNEELEELLVELRNTQDQLVSRQKLAELGELTAGVAHEIRNPLNLVQNFSTSSTDMMAELKETISALDGAPEPDEADLINELITELSENMDRIQNHCERTNRILQDMLAMGRNTSGDYQNININQLVEDYAMLAYHSARNRDPQFTMNIIRELDRARPIPLRGLGRHRTGYPQSGGQRMLRHRATQPRRLRIRTHHVGSEHPTPAIR